MDIEWIVGETGKERTCWLPWKVTRCLFPHSPADKIRRLLKRRFVEKPTTSRLYAKNERLKRSNSKGKVYISNCYNITKMAF